MPVGFEHLSQLSRARATEFFSAKPMHLAWMGNRYLAMLDKVVTKKYEGKIPFEAIKPIDFKDPHSRSLVSFYQDLKPREEHLSSLGIGALSNGELLVVDLVAGMATGFGNTAKGAVFAQLDPRYDSLTRISYLDIKLSGYLKLQEQCKKILPIAEMISDKTQEPIVNNLRSFANAKGKELILINDGAPRKELEEAWNKARGNWDKCLFVLLIRQPSTLSIGEDTKEVGAEYMKGHGDFFDVVQSQLKDFVEIAGTKYIFSSNIDNVGADVSPVILGHAIEEFQNRKIEAMVELVEKYEGDKGGVPAIVNGKLSILERHFVPKEWMDAFVGKTIFPFFNTNTFWWKAGALFDRTFDLPLMGVEKIESDAFGVKIRKIETIMGAGLDFMNFMPLVVDRGERFLPAKFLTDLWRQRTNSMVMYNGRLQAAMENGQYLHPPLIEVSKRVFSTYEELDNVIHGFGNYDKMRGLTTLIIGGMGDNFDKVGQFITHCGVRYEGDVAIIFQEKPGSGSGALIIQGAQPSDTVTLRDAVIFVPAGETIVQKVPVASDKPIVDKRVDRKMLENVLQIPVKSGKWPQSQADRVLNKFFPKKEDSMVVDMKTIFSEEKLSSLTNIAREKALALMTTFNPTGILEYEVVRLGDKIALKVKDGSKKGSAVRYKSKADNTLIEASAQKAYYIRHGDRILTYSCDDFDCVLVPNGPNASTATVLTGAFREVGKDQKLAIFKGKLKFIYQLADEASFAPDLIEEAFAKLPIKTIFDLDSRKLFDLILENSAGNIPPRPGEDTI